MTARDMLTATAFLLLVLVFVLLSGCSKNLSTTGAGTTKAEEQAQAENDLEEFSDAGITILSPRLVRAWERLNANDQKFVSDHIYDIRIVPVELEGVCCAQPKGKIGFSLETLTSSEAWLAHNYVHEACHVQAGHGGCTEDQEIFCTERALPVLRYAGGTQHEIDWLLGFVKRRDFCSSRGRKGMIPAP